MRSMVAEKDLHSEAASVVMLFTSPLIIWWLWNLTMPAFGLIEIGYWMAFRLYVITHLLFPSGYFNFRKIINRMDIYHTQR